MGEPNMKNLTKNFFVFVFVSIAHASWANEEIELSEKVKSNCDPGWTDATAVGMGCLLFSTEKENTWTEADAFCYNNHSAHQVIIRNTNQHDLLRQQLDLVYQLTGKTTAWTAGTDIGSEGYFYFSHAGSCDPVESFLWSAGEPNEGIEANFIALHEGHSWLAVDEPSSNVKAITICQTDA